MVYGALYVMISGHKLMPMLSAGNLDTPMQVTHIHKDSIIMLF